VFVSDARAAGRAALEETGVETWRLALALGTGVGGALVHEGSIVRDEGLGHGVTLKGVAPTPCPLGHASCLEAFVGTPALVRAAKASGLDVSSAEELDALAHDDRARAILAGAGERVAEAARFHFAGRPAMLVLSGGVACSSTLVAAVATRLAGVRVSQFGAFTGAAGAALLAKPPEGRST
jgi:predicted NBD/HSP70 family sugar kinase